MPSSILGCLLRARLVMIEGRLGVEEAWESAVSWPREHKTSRKSRRRWVRGVGGGVTKTCLGRDGRNRLGSQGPGLSSETGPGGTCHQWSGSPR